MKISLLNFGCGRNYRKGWINLDFDLNVKADVIFDINSIYRGERIHFPKNYFDRIILFDVLEHFPEPLPILRELYRVCKVGGIIEIKVPEGEWVWDNPQHKREFRWNTFEIPNFSEYGSKEKEVELIYKKRYVLPSRNISFRIARKLFGKTNLHVKYKKLK